jgi:hypothetical protein
MKSNNLQIKNSKSPLLAKIKFEPIFFYRFFGSFSIRKGRFRGRAEGGAWGEFRPPSVSFWRILFGFFQTHTASWKKSKEM